MFLAQHGILTRVGQGIPARDITVIIGDSNADGRGASIPGSVPAGALFNWNGSSFDAITNQSVANDGSYGSIWQAYATDFYNDTGTATYLVNCAAGGSNVVPQGDNNDWSTTGTLYAAMQTKVANAVADAAGSEVTTIVVNVCINDVRVPESIADITTHWESLLDRLHSDFPNAEIVLINIGRTETLAFNQLMVQTRNLIVDSAHTRDYCHMLSSGAFYVGVTGGYNGDNLHYSQATNDSIGQNFAKWRRYAAGYSKWARSIISAHHTDIDLTMRTKIQTLVNNLGSDFANIPYLTPLVSDDVRNYFIDFTFRSYSAPGSGGFLQSGNDWMDTNGATANCMACGYYTGFSTTGGGSGDDFNFFVRVGAIRTAAGVGAALFGRIITGGTRIELAQNAGAGVVRYVANDQTLTLYPDPDILPDTFHDVGRLASNKAYYQGSTQVDMQNVAKTADVNEAIWVGCRSNLGVLEIPINADLGFVGAFPSSVNRANLVAAVEAYLA